MQTCLTEPPCLHIRPPRRVLLILLLFTMPVAAQEALSPWLEYVGVYPRYPEIDTGEGAQAAAIRRGEYLVKLGDCIACHTDTAVGSAAFAGGLPIPTPFGTFYSPNITPDEDTGLGRWTEAEFIRAMREGIRRDGSNAFPVFPYVFFNHVTEDDLRDIWAYLRAVPAVARANRDNTLPFPLDWRWLQVGWKLLFFYPHRDTSINDPSRSAAWNRGAYLVEGLGHCSMCHTPMNRLGAQKQAYYLSGAFIDGFWAPDITGRGLSSASREQVGAVFASGQLINAAGDVRGPMADAIHDSLRYLTAADREAIATYLESVESPHAVDFAEQLKHQPPRRRGRQVYANVCIHCHRQGEAGAPRIGDGANWSGRIADSSLGVLYRHAIDGFNNMPPRGGCSGCNDADVMAAVDYLLRRSLDASQWRELKHPTPADRSRATSVGIGKQVYAQACANCHDSGRDGAPVTGNRVAWAPRLAKNFDVVLERALRGYGNMPARGGCSTCSGTEVIAAVKYMVGQSDPGRDLSLW